MFPYTVVDASSGANATAFATIDVRPPRPLALPDVYYCVFNTPCAPPVSVLANDSSPVQGTLSVGAILSPPPSGSLSWEPDGRIAFTPATGFFGSLSFAYQLVDSLLPTTSRGEVLIIIPQPDLLTAVNNTYIARYNEPYRPPSNRRPQINDYTPTPGGELQVVSVEAPPPSTGTINWTADGSFTFTPAPNFHGKVELEYQVYDPVATLYSGASAARAPPAQRALLQTPQDPMLLINLTTTAYMTIIVPPPTAPVANDDRYACTAGAACSPPGSVLDNDVTNAGGTLSVSGITSAPDPGGSVSILPNGSFTYTPSPLSFVGEVTFEYELSDSAAPNDVSAAIVTITITAPPLFIAADDDEHFGVFNQPYTPPPSKWLLLNDYSPSPNSVLEVLSTDPTGVVLTQYGASSGRRRQLLSFAPGDFAGNVTSFTPEGSFTFVPAQDFVGTATFMYTAIDRGLGQTATARVLITYRPPQAPLTQPDLYYCTAGETCSPPVSVLANDSSTTGGAISVVALMRTPQPSGTVKLTPSGAIEFTPVPL